MTLDINTDALSDIERNISSISTSALDEIAQTIESDIKLNFRNQVAPDGTPWKPLKPATRKVRGLNAKILQDKGNLKKSLNTETLSDRIKIGFGVKYSVFHQLGVKNMVARKILPTESDEIDMEEIERIILKDINV